ncbi:MAG: methyltransferase domain-containing protein [Gallionella sp.]|nr:methyltransferase domain-containing protein [Gallionella sp.]
MGQFIPHVYHYHMLTDQARMDAFREAIALAVPAGSRVLELGGGTAVLSFFAAQHAAKVWCVEKNPELVRESRRILALNPGCERVEIVEADAFDYLPPEPVDVVICEMLHVGMLREKQIPIIESFKRRYLEKFGGALPRFVPEAFIQAVQPVQQSFDFDGYYAPTAFFQPPAAEQPRSVDLATPAVYQIACYAEDLPDDCSWQGEITIERAGQLNALRFITKNIVAIDGDAQRTVDWFSQYLIVPLAAPLAVAVGQQISVRFAYQPGDPIAALQPCVTLAD